VEGRHAGRQAGRQAGLVPGARPYVVRGSESMEERGSSFIHAHPADDDDDDDDRVGGGACVAIGGNGCRRRCCRGKRERGSKRRRSPQQEARGRDGTETEALVAASTGCGSSASSLFLSLLNYISLKASKAFEQSTTKGDVNLVPRTQEFFLGEF
jgi:hypothetical protein